jgi:hypothetical protein
LGVNQFSADIPSNRSGIKTITLIISSIALVTALAAGILQFFGYDANYLWSLRGIFFDHFPLYPIELLAVISADLLPFALLLSYLILLIKHKYNSLPLISILLLANYGLEILLQVIASFIYLGFTDFASFLRYSIFGINSFSGAMLSGDLLHGFPGITLAIALIVLSIKINRAKAPKI